MGQRTQLRVGGNRDAKGVMYTWMGSTRIAHNQSWDMTRCMRLLSWIICLSGFKPSSTLLVQVRNQLTSQGPLRKSIMSLDGWVHPQKIYQMCLMCSYSHYLIYWLMGQASIMTSTWTPLCWLAKAYDIVPSIQTSSHWDLEASPTKDYLHILRCTLWIMHNYLDLMTDLSSHPCTQWPTSVIPCVSLMNRQCQIPVHWSESWELIPEAHHSQLVLACT